jgi:hypothetical protein
MYVIVNVWFLYEVEWICFCLSKVEDCGRGRPNWTCRNLQYCLRSNVYYTQLIKESYNAVPTEYVEFTANHDSMP